MESRRTSILILGFLALWQGLLLTVFLSRDKRPLAADSAQQLRRARQGEAFFPVFQKPLSWAAGWAESSHRSPEDAAALTNVLSLFLLGAALARLGGELGESENAAPAAFLATLGPGVLLLARETLPWLPLAAWVAATYAAWESSAGFSRWGWSLAAGIALAAGCLTHWAFPVFVLPPLLNALWALLRRRWGVIFALVPALGIVFPWYKVNAETLTPHLTWAVSQLGAGWAGVVSPGTWTYYIFQSGPEVGWWVGILGAAGLGRTLFFRRRSFGILFAWLMSGYVLLSLIPARDPHWLMPAYMVLPLAASLLPRGIPRLTAGFMLVFSIWFCWGPPGAPFSQGPRPAVVDTGKKG
jgi:hypothetical protein